MDKLKFPIGKFEKPKQITSEILSKWIQNIEQFHDKLSKVVSGLTDNQLDTPYRDGGWTIRQVVHHCADSHMNSLMRFKLALTEDNPTIKPYYEDRWAELPDGKKMDLAPSLQIISGLHTRWVYLLNSFTAEELERTFVHPEHNQSVTIKENIGIYAWHCNHHLAHITQLIASKNW